MMTRVWRGVGKQQPIPIKKDATKEFFSSKKISLAKVFDDE